MPTLKEIKNRIASVQSTLKITSAMKLVSSAKLRKAQTAIEAMRPYQERLSAMLELASGTKQGVSVSGQPEIGPLDTKQGVSVPGRTVVIAMASNSSLCGGFNAQVIAKTKEVLRECPGARVIAIGRKMSDALRKSCAQAYKPSVISSSPSVISSEAEGEVEKSPFLGDSLSEHPSYAPVSAITDALIADSSVDCVLLVYNHFVSTGKQVPVVETLLSKEISPRASLGRNDNVPASLGRNDRDVISASSSVISSGAEGGVEKSTPDVILEPSRQELLEALYPKSVKIRFFAALLDSAAAEHAARTVAMQAATDNGEDLLQELTLQYNKGRQQKITNEILDLAGGSQTQ
jgi:F-type H+-transporting ATPase subunit gamma